MKTIICTLITCFLFTGTPFAQQAPDFTFSDTDGNEHNLYHALNQGFIVLLDFFFVDCPPCVETSPELQAIKEDYEGKNVLIFSISDRDSDAYIEQFKQELELDLIAGGMDGGGDEVFALYENEFNFLGWPTFAVICPDTSITWDIFPIGIGASELRNAIEECGIENAAPYQPINPVSASEVEEADIVLKLFPNPVKDILIMEVLKYNQGLLRIDIFNSIGQKVMTTNFYAQHTIQLKTIDLSMIPAGIYHLEITLGTEKINRKIIKL